MPRPGYAFAWQWVVDDVGLHSVCLPHISTLSKLKMHRLYQHTHTHTALSIIHFPVALSFVLLLKDLFVAFSFVLSSTQLHVNCCTYHSMCSYYCTRVVRNVLLSVVCTSYYLLTDPNTFTFNHTVVLSSLPLLFSWLSFNILLSYFLCSPPYWCIMLRYSITNTRQAYFHHSSVFVF